MVSVHVFSSAAHLLSPTRSASEAELAVRQTLTSALATSSDHPASFMPASPEHAGQGTIVVPSAEFIKTETETLRQACTNRQELDATAKLFLPHPSAASSFNSSSVSSPLETVKLALSELEQLLGNAERVDTLVLSWAGVSYGGEELDFFTNKKPEDLIGAREEADSGVDDAALASIVELWQALQTLPALASASLGVTSFSQALLARFLSALPRGAKRPVVNHLNLRDCCHIPQAFSAFAQAEGVRLVSNSDPAEPVKSEALPRIFEPYGSTLSLPASARPSLNWTLKYTVLHKARGVLIDKGYILSTSWQP